MIRERRTPAERLEIHAALCSCAGVTRCAFRAALIEELAAHVLAPALEQLAVFKSALRALSASEGKTTTTTRRHRRPPEAGDP